MFHMVDSNAQQPITANLSVTDISVQIVVEFSSHFLILMGLWPVLWSIDEISQLNEF